MLCLDVTSKPPEKGILVKRSLVSERCCSLVLDNYTLYPGGLVSELKEETKNLAQVQAFIY